MPSSRGLPNLGFKLVFVMSLALADRFFKAMWEAHIWVDRFFRAMWEAHIWVEQGEYEALELDG